MKPLENRRLFLLFNRVYIIKGKMKLERFKKIYPDVKLVFVSQTDYRSLYKEYKDIIPNWEKVST